MNFTTHPRCFALIPAAGVGARMDANCPKQYLHIAGKSILQHSVNAFLQHNQIHHVFVVVSPGDGYVAQELAGDPRLTVLFCGGATRSDSVMNGLAAAGLGQLDWVLVHDAARPGLTSALIGNLIDRVGHDGVGGLLAMPVVDTVKLQSKDKVTTVPRTGLWLAQTPQMFKYDQLLTALTDAKKNNVEITDEASAMERMGCAPTLVEGHWCNTKITRPDDVSLVAAYLNAKLL